jgi:adenosine deaminase
MSKRDFYKMPKVELHCHLDGSMPLEIVRELSGNQAIIAADLQVENDCPSLAKYLEKFELPCRCLQTKEGLKRASYALLEEVAKENVRYIEVRFAPVLSINEGLSLRETMEGVIAGLESGYQDFGVRAQAIVCGLRHLSIEDNIAMLKVARELLGEGVCALDLAGDEGAYPNREFRELFVKAKEWAMPHIIHAGETGDVENVREALVLNAIRIGHGIALRQDEALIEEYVKHGVGIEMCPTSNIQTKAINNWADYPLVEFVRRGLKVSVNTDNRTVSNTTLTKEFELIYESCKDDDVIYQLQRNAIETSFASDDIKHDLLKEIL